MSKEQAISVLMLIAALASYIEPSETTRKFDKLRKHIRKSLNALHRANRGEYNNLSIKSNDVWEIIKKEIADDHFTISVSFSLLALYAFIERTEHAEMFFTKKTFYEAINSIQHSDRANASAPDSAKVERDTNRLCDAFASVLNVEKNSKLAAIKAKLKNELLLQNMEYKDMA